MLHGLLENAIYGGRIDNNFDGKVGMMGVEGLGCCSSSPDTFIIHTFPATYVFPSLSSHSLPQVLRTYLQQFFNTEMVGQGGGKVRGAGREDGGRVWL